ncbi:5-formyltetrahydrofolate cyclo-ligase [Catenovulum maritimum]|uniref:5-formyltetrahydrofolate cyclo-ligase n=1 Tax=Catenovulum maritimum TaxID=1513271 RepID=A0A0J8GP92_9ALTE|nr:5-formyltetrahydrofolate cyclo-ligase [Catenovulum maritimum]KMT64592.1 hypothetical protein XM47_13170 [Catenovulum maritimum]
MTESRKQIRQKIRKLRQNLTPTEQQIASQQIAEQVLNRFDFTDKDHVAIYLSNDGELDTHLLIQALWQLDVKVYLPVLHHFCTGYLSFYLYQPETPMIKNKYGILEPELNCTTICPIKQLEYVFLPLVAFDSEANRLGMGGGFYDRTFEHKNPKTKLIGLAHDCQKVDKLPIESWDVPLDKIISPSYNI